MTDLPDMLLVGVGILLAGVVVARFADRLGAPALLLFLGLGILLGEDGPGGITFDDVALTEHVGVVALALILFEGGLSAERASLKRVLGAAISLGTVGVLVTAGVVGATSAVLLDLSPREGLLVGAVVSSTDAAAVFSAVRNVPLRTRLRVTLEGESGLNDPTAALLVIMLVESLTTPSFGAADAVVLLVQQAVIGVAGGFAFGRASRWLLERGGFASAGLYPVATLAAALSCFVTITLLGGSGFLAVYLLGLMLGGRRVPHIGVVESFHAGTAWLAQITLFVLLGLLVDPSELTAQGLAPLGVVLVLIVVARPLAVWLSLLPFGYPAREQGFLAWAGLRGGVPIVFATVPIVEGVTSGRRIFDIAFYVVVVSVLIQGVGLRPAARALGVADETSRLRLADLDVATLRSLGAELIEVRVGELGTAAGQPLRDTPIPGGGIVAVIRRGDAVVTPRGSTVLEDGDVLYVLVERKSLPQVERALADRA